MAVSHDKFSSRYDQMAPHSCPFEISNFDTFSTTPPKHVWDFWDSPGGGKEIFFFLFTISFFRGFDHSSFSFPPPGDLNVLESSDRTNGWPPYGGWPFVLVPRLYHGKAPWERWDIGGRLGKSKGKWRPAICPFARRYYIWMTGRIKGK